MKALAFLFAISLLITSCITVKFEHPQPKDAAQLNAFPHRLTGIYISNSDTLTLNDNSFNFGNHQKDVVHLAGTIPSDSCVLKQINEYLVMNLRDSAYWQTMLIKDSSDYLNVFYISLNKEDSLAIKMLKKITDVKDIKAGDGSVDYYLANPTDKEFEKLIKKNLFAMIGQFRKIK